jgi:hypothetical protein
MSYTGGYAVAKKVPIPLTVLYASLHSPISAHDTRMDDS